MAVNALAQLAQIGGAPRAELPPAQSNGMDPNKGYGRWFSSIPNLQKIEDPAQGADGVLETYTDGQNIYRVMRQTSGGGASLTNEYDNGGAATANNKFPVSIHKSSLADYYMHEETGTLRPRIGSSQLIVHPDTGETLEANKYDGRSTGKTFKTFLISAAAVFAAAYAATSMLAAGSAGGAGGAGGAAGGTAGGTAGTTGAAGTAGTTGLAEGAGSSLFGQFGTAGPVSGGFSSGVTAGQGLGAYGGFGAGATYGGSIAGSMAGLEAAGAAGSAASAMGNGAAPLEGTPPPSNPYHPGSYFNAENLSNLASSTMSGSGGFSWTDLIPQALNLAGGAYSANQAGKAADAQIQAAREAMALNEPFRQFGIKSGNRLMDYAGLSGNTGAEGYNLLNKDFTAADFQTDPGYEFRKSEGERGLTRAASAAGGLGSGKYLKDAMRFNSGLASQEFGNAHNRFQVNRTNRINPLLSIMGAGQTSANTIGEFATQAGNAAAAGRIGQANALTNTINQGWSMYNNNQQRNQNQVFQNALMTRWANGG